LQIACGKSFITRFQPDNGDLSKFNLILDRYEQIKKTLSRKAGQQKTVGALPNTEFLSKFFNISHEDALSQVIINIVKTRAFLSTRG